MLIILVQLFFNHILFKFVIMTKKDSLTVIQSDKSFRKYEFIENHQLYRFNYYKKIPSSKVINSLLK
jgi:hypothetical protein